MSNLVEKNVDWYLISFAVTASVTHNAMPKCATPWLYAPFYA